MANIRQRLSQLEAELAQRQASPANSGPDIEALRPGILAKLQAAQSAPEGATDPAPLTGAHLDLYERLRRIGAAERDNHDNLTQL